jgi:hypothetical protein
MMSVKLKTLALVISLIVVLSGAGVVDAQKSEAEPRSSSPRTKDDPAKAREEVAKSVVGSLVLDAVTVKETDWSLSTGTFIPKMNGGSPSGVYVSFKKRDEAIHINVAEFETAERAEETFNPMLRSMGSGDPFKIGDRGEKIYINGRMTGLNFRVGNLKVSIGGTTDEKLAERFAGHVLEAIKGIASK